MFIFLKTLLRTNIIAAAKLVLSLAPALWFCMQVFKFQAKIWHRTGLFPYHQGLIFGELSLSDLWGQTSLYDVGIRNNSLIRLVIVTRSGPLAIAPTEKVIAPCPSVVATTDKLVTLNILFSFFDIYT